MIPARNEAEVIQRTLLSVAAQGTDFNIITSKTTTEKNVSRRRTKSETKGSASTLACRYPSKLTLTGFPWIFRRSASPFREVCAPLLFRLRAGFVPGMFLDDANSMPAAGAMGQIESLRCRPPNGLVAGQPRIIELQRKWHPYLAISAWAGHSNCLSCVVDRP